SEIENKIPNRGRAIINYRLFIMRAITDRDKKMIIWNFMGELWDKNQRIVEKNIRSDYHIKDFRSMNIFINYLYKIGVGNSKDGAVVLETLKKYAQDKGLIEIEDDTIRLTETGLHEFQKSNRDFADWDQ